MTYLAAAYNEDDTTALHAVTDPQAFTSLQAMRSSDTDLRLTSCKPTPRGDYMCSFRSDYVRGRDPGQRTAMVIAAPEPWLVHVPVHLRLRLTSGWRPRSAGRADADPAVAGTRNIASVFGRLRDRPILAANPAEAARSLAHPIAHCVSVPRRFRVALAAGFHPQAFLPRRIHVSIQLEPVLAAVRQMDVT